MIARIQNRDLHVIGASVDWKMDVVTDFKITVLLQQLPDIRSVRLADVELYDRGSLIVSGFVSDAPDLKPGKNKVSLVELGCFDELGRLTCKRATADAHYQDAMVVDILDALLLTTGGEWALGDLSTMIDPTIATTIDLRKKETLFAQIAAVVKAVPDVHLRYGGIVSGVYQLQIGNFNAATESFVQGRHFTDLNLKRSEEPVYRVVEAYGNQSAFRRLSLADALSDARTVLHPDYVRFPITQDPITLAWVVTDQQRETGCEVTKFFDLQKTRNDEPPAAAEIAEAGYAVWLKCVRFLKSNVEFESYSAQIITDRVPLVGNRAYLKAHVTEPVYDPVTQLVAYQEPMYAVDDSFRITSVSMDFSEPKRRVESVLHTEENAITLKIELSSSDEAEITDSDLELYERVADSKSFDQSDRSLGFQVPPPVQVTHELEAADCDYDGLTPGTLEGKSFTATSPIPPGWVNHVTVQFAFNLPNIQYRIVDTPQPNDPGDDLILCVRDSTGAWPSTEGPITLTVQYVFTK